MNGGSAAKRALLRAERAAELSGYKVVRSAILDDGRVHVDLVRKRKARTIRRVYFIQMEQSTHVKIGIANNTQKRLRALQTANPERLVLLGTLAGDADDEAELHRILAPHRMAGEWFAAGDWLDTARHAIKWGRPAGALILTLKAKDR